MCLTCMSSWGVAAQLARLAQLETLWLDDNHLTEIPDCLLRLRRLTLLRLSGNRITTVPDSISTLGMLQELVRARVAPHRGRRLGAGLTPT